MRTDVFRSVTNGADFAGIFAGLKTITLRVEARSFPNQVGSEQKRTIASLTASELKLSNPIALTGGEIHYVMKRASTVVLN
jgi:hypothetical protein